MAKEELDEAVERLSKASTEYHNALDNYKELFRKEQPSFTFTVDAMESVFSDKNLSEWGDKSQYAKQFQIPGKPIKSEIKMSEVKLHHFQGMVYLRDIIIQLIREKSK